MVPKTERFEMRLEPETLDRVDEWRAQQDDVPSRSEAIRRLVEKGLGASSSNTLQPTNTEKLMMWMLAEILKNQDTEEDKTAELIQKTIYGGHFWALQWELTGILHNHVDSQNALTLVVDTLDMWTFIERAYAGFEEADKQRIENEVGPWAKNPRFSGFDGNNEGEHMAIARFLVKEMGRFSDFKDRSLNSHSPKVQASRRMTKLFEPMRTKLVGRELSVDDVVVLLKRE
ncbi:YfbU family protein [Mesorhizobium sp. M0227]|uniref:YfbU family protein n=1 Tax=unclassified Mesorhizobium TaxID=325217 RepID=UPI003339DF8B